MVLLFGSKHTRDTLKMSAHMPIPFTCPSHVNLWILNNFCLDLQPSSVSSCIITLLINHLLMHHFLSAWLSAFRSFSCCLIHTCLTVPSKLKHEQMLPCSSSQEPHWCGSTRKPVKPLQRIYAQRETVIGINYFWIWYLLKFLSFILTLINST